ncbi:MAG: hypothetical protein E6590_11265 [Clostridiales bacterium]|uniref:hypothetical protein n=1 Tax=Zhenhengia sp. TaxID=2944208 RepID=UPI002909D8C4|nr:hypothetical protein [Clostridiales bacterium]
MRKSETRISANEINRFMYCPNQWYYKRIYGTKALNEQYKALGIESSSHESNFEKGMQHHKRYHLKYRLLCYVRWGIMLIIVLSVMKVVIEWIQ